MPVVIPIHPRTRKKLQELNFNFKQTRLQLVDPVGYLEMVYLLKHCSLVATDSGGLQKEAYFFKNTVSHSELKRNGLNWLNKELISLRVGDTKIF